MSSTQLGSGSLTSLPKTRRLYAAGKTQRGRVFLSYVVREYKGRLKQRSPISGNEDPIRVDGCLNTKRMRKVTGRKSPK